MSHPSPARAVMVTAALAVGVLVALQSRINAELSRYVGGGLLAATISFGTGLALAWVLILSRSHLRSACASIPRLIASGRLRRWQLLGGLGGAWLVTNQGIVVGAFGVAVFTIGVVAGQVGGSLLVDRAGLSPAGKLPVSGNRVVAAVVALAAVVVAGLGSGVEAASWVVLLAASAGLGISVQQAINARVASATGQPMAATGVNFLVGFSALFLLSAAAMASGVAVPGSLPDQWWLYLGGPIGVLFIALAAWAVRGVGVLVFGLLSIAGQLIGSVAMDVIAPSVDGGLGWSGAASLGLIVVAVLLATAGGRVRR